MGSTIGIKQRTTLDIDLKYIGINLGDIVLLNNEINYEVLDITKIVEKKKYSGKSVRIKIKN